jgi:hypothetical protein
VAHCSPRQRILCSVFTIKSRQQAEKSPMSSILQAAVIFYFKNLSSKLSPFTLDPEVFLFVPQSKNIVLVWYALSHIFWLQFISMTIDAIHIARLQNNYVSSQDYVRLIIIFAQSSLAILAIVFIEVVFNRLQSIVVLVGNGSILLEKRWNKFPSQQKQFKNNCFT